MEESHENPWVGSSYVPILHRWSSSFSECLMQCLVFEQEKGTIERHHTRAEDRFQWEMMLSEWNDHENRNVQRNNDVIRKKGLRMEDGSLNVDACFVVVLLFS